MASSMGQTWEVTSFTYLFFDHFQTNLAVGRDISPIESVAQCLPVLEGGFGAMHPPHHASAWTLPAQWLSGTHSQSQTTLRWVWFPKTFTVRCDHQGYTISQCVFYILHFTWTIPWVSESPYYFGGPGSTRFRQFIQLLDPHVLTSCSRDAPGKHGKAWRSALRIFMGRPRMATISQDFLLPYQALSRKWQLKQATSTSVWWMDKSNMLLSVPRFYVPQEGYTKRFKDFWRKQFWDRFLQNEGCPNHSCVHHRYPKSWEMPTRWHVLFSDFNMCCILKPSEAPYMFRSRLALCQWFNRALPRLHRLATYEYLPITARDYMVQYLRIFGLRFPMMSGRCLVLSHGGPGLLSSACLRPLRFWLIHSPSHG